MHHNIDYRGDNSPRRAIIDLVKWFGLSKSKLIIRAARHAATIADAKERNRYYSALAFSIEIGGVSGYPVRQLFQYYGSPELLNNWLSS